MKCNLIYNIIVSLIML